MSDGLLWEEEVTNSFGGLTLCRYFSDGFFVVAYDSEGRMVGNNFIDLDGVPDDGVITLKTSSKEVVFMVGEIYGNDNQSVNHL